MRWLLPVCFFMILTGSAIAAPVADSLPPAKPFTAPSWVAVRSLIVPGWGQYYNGKKFKALIFAGTQVSFGLGIIKQDRLYRENQHYRDVAWNYYKNQVGPSHLVVDSLAAADYGAVAKFYQKDRNKLIWWSAGVMLLSVFDAFVDSHLHNFDVGPALGKEGEPQVQLTIRF